MWLYYILIFTAFAPYHPVLNASVAGITLSKAIGVVALFAAIGSLPNRADKLFRLSKVISIPLVLYLLVTIASSAIRGSGPTLEAGEFTKYLAIISTVAVTFIMVDTPERLRKVAMASLVCLCICSFYAIKQFIAFRGTVDNRGFGGLEGDPNYHAAVVVLYLPFIVLFTLAGSSFKERLMALGTAMLSLIGFATTGSRGGLLGLGVEILFLSIVFRKVRYAFMICVLLVPFLIVLPTSPLHRLSDPTSSDIQAADSRIVMWRASWRTFLDHPIFGAGLNPPADYNVWAILGIADPHLRATHNTYLELLRVYGLMGTIPYVWLLGAGIYAMRRVARQTQDKRIIQAARATQAGLLGYAVCIFFISAWWQMTYWLLIGLSAAISRLANVEPVAAPAPVTPVPVALDLGLHRRAFRYSRDSAPR